MINLNCLNPYSVKSVRKKISQVQCWAKMKTEIKLASEKFCLNSKISDKSRRLYFISEHVFLRSTYNNIISRQTSTVLYRKHIFDSLSIATVFKSFWITDDVLNCIDFGTGGGFPGLLLSIAFPEIFISLLDSIERKVKFHIGIIGILNIKNCNSICLRGEQLGNLLVYQEKFDIITSRAVAELIDLLPLFSCITSSKGKLIIMKKIEGCEKEIDSTSIYFPDPKFKLKCLVKVDRKRSGKVIIIYKKS